MRRVGVALAAVLLGVLVAVSAASGRSGGSYGRLLAQSHPLASDLTLGYLANTRLPTNLHLFTLVFTGPPGKMAVNGFINCVNPGINVRAYPIMARPYVRSYRTPPRAGVCGAGGDSSVAITNPDGSTRIVPATIRLYGR